MLGSYDPETTKILKSLREFIAERFERDELYALMLENVDIYQSEKVDVVLERLSDRRATLMVFNKKSELIDVEDVEFEDDVSGIMREKYGVESFIKTPVLEKLRLLASAAWLVFLIRHLEQTRGGELIELTYISNFCRDRIFLLKKEGVKLSTMVEELIEAFKINLRTYVELRELFDTVERIIMYRLEQSWV